MSRTAGKVLHVIDSLDLGGAQTFLLGLCRSLDPDRYRPEVACMHGRGIFTTEFEEAGIPVRSLSRALWPPDYLANFAGLMAVGDYDILHFHLFGANLCAKPLAILAGHPRVVVHDQCNDASRDSNPLLLAADAFWNRFSRSIIAVSESTRRYLLDREDLPDDRVRVIPNGIDTDAFRPGSGSQREMARLELGLPPDAEVVGGVGRLVDQKNYPLFLETAALLLKTRPGTRFAIAGTGPLDADLRGLAARLGIGDKVIFLGQVAGRRSLYHAFDAFLMTSAFEGTPMALLEAMACGVPVVASAVDGIAEVCTHGRDAFLVREGGAPAYAAFLARVLEEPLGRNMGREARETVGRDYDIGFLARRIMDLYDGFFLPASGMG